MRYYKYDLNYNYVGFEDSDVVIPSATIVEPTSSSHTLWNPATSLWEEHPAIPETLEELKRNKNRLVAAHFDEIVENSRSTAARFEPDTYRAQEYEWRAWANDNTVNTPYVDTLAATRGLSKELLMGKIGNKIQEYSTVQGSLHHYQDLINNCVTVEELNSLVMPWDI